jgi:hypothetical protein
MLGGRREEREGERKGEERKERREGRWGEEKGVSLLTKHYALRGRC